ncbi:hypothetical protein M758_2G241400 [Ceratodon purpureus]|uniref:Uncharacterized protein n=1 Tax=Ceratodon purpureus TaxID=3225 RepID=A0A8T0J258_CERPU|nr:hypothetical protein KC19_2G288200 [Ceratodon purpureus]KAG0627980.1 hypothetical protein M758_2G241400 [Ceratodon purpureus]
MANQPDLMGITGLPEEPVLKQLWHAILEPVSQEMLWEAMESPEKLPVERLVNLMALRASSKKFCQLVDSTVEGASLRLAIHFAKSEGLSLEIGKKALLIKVYTHYIENLMLLLDEMEVNTCPHGSAWLTTPLQDLSIEQLVELRNHLTEARAGQFTHPCNTLKRFPIQKYVPPPPGDTREEWGFLYFTGGFPAT